ncbi:AAA family ATPase [Candidatus Pacearchaeota archaeon]|nr:AAA family ATPase [Candidatus Pacearchaeota archaeon]
MILKRLKVQNIRSYENFEVLFNKGSTLLAGDIGSGKTSILLAIEFALFGLQPGQKGASLLRNGQDEGFVELEFEVDGNNIIINRNLKRKKTISQDSSSIEINGKTEEKAVTELKNIILNLLNYPLEFSKKTNILYKFTVYTPQEQMKEIILEDPEIRLNTLRHVFGVDKYKRIKENSSILSAKLREAVRLKQGQIGDLDTLKIRMNEKINSLREIENKIPEIENKLNDIKLSRKTKQDEIDEVDVKIEEKKKFENEIDKINLLLIGKREQFVKLDKEINSIKSRFEQAVKDFNEKDLENILNLLKEKKEHLEIIRKDLTDEQIKLSSFASKKSELGLLKFQMESLTKCPTCLQEVSVDHKNSILSQANAELENINGQIDLLEKNKNKYQGDLKKINDEVISYEQESKRMEALKIRMKTLEEDSNRPDVLEKQKIAFENDILMLNEQINRMKENILTYKKYENILLIKEKELDEIKNTERMLEIKKAELTKEIEFEKKSINDLESNISEKEKIKGELIYATELENWVSKDFLDVIGFIERNVLTKLKDEFSELFNEWFSILVPDVFSVRLDDAFTPIIEQQDYELDYNFLSGGERTAIALAYRLALNQTINSIMSEIKTKGLVILDEPTEGFSQQQLDKMRDVLNQLNVEQLIIVSHDQKIESFVENIIRLKKDHGITKVNNT